MQYQTAFRPTPVDTDFAIGSARYLARQGYGPEQIAEALATELHLDDHVARRLSMLPIV